MKRILSALTVCVMLFSLAAVFSFAAEDALPFRLVAPGNVYACWEKGNDSPTTTTIAYSLSNEMTAFFKQVEEAHLNDTYAELISKYGIDELSITTQVDWAVDDVKDEISGWHCNEYWNGDYGFGHDEEYNCRVGEWDGADLWVGNATETVNTHAITRYVSEDALNGNPETHTPGLKDQMRPSQYEYRYNEDGDGNLYIDYTKHTVYFRMRFVVTTGKDTDEGTVVKYYYSDWSNVAAVGKDGDEGKVLTKADIAAPVITGLRMTDKEFNGNPVAAFTLTVPDELAMNASKAAAYGGGIFIETQMRVKGDAEWTEMGNTDWIIRAGEMECALLHLVNASRPNIPKDTVIETRCRYRCSQKGEDDVYSDWSKIISFGTDDVNYDDTAAHDPSGKKTCPICHFCPQPLGLCIFIWLLILLVVVAIVVVVIVVVSKSKKKNEKNDQKKK